MIYKGYSDAGGRPLVLHAILLRWGGGFLARDTYDISSAIQQQCTYVCTAVLQVSPGKPVLTACYRVPPQDSIEYVTRRDCLLFGRYVCVSFWLQQPFSAEPDVPGKI